MHCKTPIEWAFYAATKNSSRKDICCHCAKSGAQIDKETRKTHKTVLPLCDQCRARGKKVLKRGPIQTAKANKERARSKK